VPIYEYVCESCGAPTEVMQKISDPPPRTCPTCGADRLARLVSRTSFQLKGGGWYADLYASKKSESPKAPADGAAGAGTGGEQTKPAADKPAAAATAPSAPAAPAKGGGGTSSGSGSPGSGSSSSGAA